MPLSPSSPALRRRPLLRAALLLSLAAAACADGARAGEPAPGNAAPRREYPARRVAASGEDAVFSEVTSLDVDSRGRIYVADWAGPVTVLSPEGRFLRTVGRKGRGPGELLSATGVQILPGDSLQLYDAQLARLTVFAPEGDSAAEVRYVVSATSPAPPFVVRRARSAVRLLAGYRRPFTPGDDPADDGERSDVLRLLDAASPHRGGDTLLVVPSPEMLVARTGRGISVRPHPFGRRGIVRLGPDDRVFRAWTDSAGVEVLSLDGRRVGGFSLPFRAPPVTDADVDSVLAGAAPPLRRALAESVPGTWPAVREMVVDDRGRVWLALAAPAGEPAEWAAFTADGRHLGSVRLPPRVQVHVIRGGRAYAVERDEMDVPRVVVLQLDPHFS